MTKLTAIVADDHSMIRQGLRQILVGAGLEVVGEAENGLEAIAMVRSHQPSLLTLDIAMPYARGIEVFYEVRRWSPDTKVLVFSGLTAVSLLSDLVETGVDGLFLKRDELASLADAIPVVLSGQQVFGTGVVELLETAPKDTQLTMREQQILSLITQGLQNREVAERLGVSAKTIDNHRTNLMRKINAHSVAELLSFAMREGYFDASKET